MVRALTLTAHITCMFFGWAKHESLSWLKYPILPIGPLMKKNHFCFLKNFEHLIIWGKKKKKPSPTPPFLVSDNLLQWSTLLFILFFFSSFLFYYWGIRLHFPPYHCMVCLKLLRFLFGGKLIRISEASQHNWLWKI